MALGARESSGASPEWTGEGERPSAEEAAERSREAEAVSTLSRAVTQRVNSQSLAPMRQMGKIDRVSHCLLVQRPILHIVVLFAGDGPVRRYAEEVQERFLTGGINCYLQLEHEGRVNGAPPQYVRPDALQEIIAKSTADFLVVLGDRNMRNTTCQVLNCPPGARRNGRLVEMEIDQRISAMQRDFEGQKQTRHVLDREIDSTTADQVVSVVGAFGGARNVKERLGSLRKGVDELQRVVRKAGDSPPPDLRSRSTQLMFTAVRLHKELRQSIRLLQIIPHTPARSRLQRGLSLGCLGQGTEFFTKNGLNANLRDKAVRELGEIPARVEALAARLVTFAGEPNVWALYTASLPRGDPAESGPLPPALLAAGEKEEIRLRRLRREREEERELERQVCGPKEAGQQQQQQQQRSGGQGWNCPSCTYLNERPVPECEMCGRPRKTKKERGGSGESTKTAEGWSVQGEKKDRVKEKKQPKQEREPPVTATPPARPAAPAPQPPPAPHRQPPTAQRPPPPKAGRRPEVVPAQTTRPAWSGTGSGPGSGTGNQRDGAWARGRAPVTAAQKLSYADFPSLGGEKGNQPQEEHEPEETPNMGADRLEEDEERGRASPQDCFGYDPRASHYDPPSVESPQRSPQRPASPPAAPASSSPLRLQEPPPPPAVASPPAPAAVIAPPASSTGSRANASHSAVGAPPTTSSLPPPSTHTSIAPGSALPSASAASASSAVGNAIGSAPGPGSAIGNALSSADVDLPPARSGWPTEARALDLTPDWVHADRLGQEWASPDVPPADSRPSWLQSRWDPPLQQQLMPQASLQQQQPQQQQKRQRDAAAQQRGLPRVDVTAPQAPPGMKQPLAPPPQAVPVSAPPQQPPPVQAGHPAAAGLSLPTAVPIGYPPVTVGLPQGPLPPTMHAQLRATPKGPVAAQKGGRQGAAAGAQVATAAAPGGGRAQGQGQGGRREGRGAGFWGAEGGQKGSGGGKGGGGGAPRSFDRELFGSRMGETETRAEASGNSAAAAGA
eukprot:Hpha_TRINITY_DN15544_c2_g5::TRINITY_DN15544_c2_g5_i1::g.108141::m.108141